MTRTKLVCKNEHMTAFWFSEPSCGILLLSHSLVIACCVDYSFITPIREKDEERGGPQIHLVIYCCCIQVGLGNTVSMLCVWNVL